MYKLICIHKINFGKHLCDHISLGPIKLASPRHCLLKCLYQVSKVGGCVLGVCFFLTLSTIFLCSLELFVQCGFLVCFWFYSIKTGGRPDPFRTVVWISSTYAINVYYHHSSKVKLIPARDDLYSIQGIKL
jgi:hypothetical protein